LIVGGLLNKQAVCVLGISEVTLQIHRSQVMRKMQADSLAELVRMAVKLRIPFWCDNRTRHDRPTHPSAPELFGIRVIVDAFQRPLGVGQIGRQLAETGARSLPLVIASGFAVGTVLTFHTRRTMVMFGAGAEIPTDQAIAFFIEIGPLTAALTRRHTPKSRLT